MVAAGLLRVARFLTPNIWDVAGGFALVQAAGGSIRANDGTGWQTMHRFEPGSGPGDKPDLRFWRRQIVIGTPDAVEQMCAAASS